MLLLSPAGSPESLRAALQNGADGAYFGGAAFNARRGAANFTELEMQAALDQCHLYGTRAFVTMNTLLTGRELPAALSYARFLYEAGADALIVQDLGLVRLLQRELPGFPLHASTQMGVCDIPGARLLQAMGFACVVLAREVSCQGIAAIHEGVDIPLEVFAHGALCMGFSGACLLSSMAGGRSGNRGTCAQPCRKRAAVNQRPGPADYALSLSDLCLLEHLGDLRAAGVTWLKLEGRMKRPEYVAAVTAAYRAALDGAGPEELAGHRARMLALFDRGGGRVGYFYGDGARTGCVARSEPPAALLKELAASYAGENRRQPVALELALRRGEPARLTLTMEQRGEAPWGGQKTVTVAGPAPGAAEKPQDPRRYLEQVQRLGDTPFYAASCGGEVDGGAYLPVRALNGLRRQGCEALLAALRFRRPPAPEPGPADEAPAPFRGEAAVLVTARTLEQAQAAAAAGAGLVALEAALGVERALEALQPLRGRAKLLLALPAAAPQGRETERLAGLLRGGGIDGALAANLGQAGLLEGLGLKIAGTQLGAFNAQGVRALKALGFDRVLLSLELTKAQMRDILAVEAAGVSAYGRAQLMQLLHCPLKERAGCAGCPGEGAFVEDEAGRRFPLSPLRGAEGCLVRLLNCLPTDVLDLLGGLPRPALVQLAFYQEGPGEVGRLVGRAKAALVGEGLEPPQNATRGHWNRAVE